VQNVEPAAIEAAADEELAPPGVDAGQKPAVV
jgi:hypothetical protein